MTNGVKRWIGWFSSLGVVFFLFIAVQTAGSSEPEFKSEPALKQNVDFWIQVYTRYSNKEGVIHDARYVNHVYEIIDFKKTHEKSSISIKKAKERWKRVLLSLHHKQTSSEPLTADEKRVNDLFKDLTEPNKFLKAAHRKRLRFQLGMKDQFMDGLYQSGQYLPIMEEIFKREGLPVELTRLPFVESGFNLKARSKVGASGIWQFMQSTARIFIQVDDAVDDRNDPIRATEAASRLLRLNYETLHKWPLAIAAYNHGRKRLMRAVRRVGSDEYGAIMNEYRSRSFGFASSNFLAELLAAVEVEKNSEKYFRNLRRSRPIASVEMTIPDFIKFSALRRGLDLDPKTVREFNPGLNEPVFSGKLLVPAGYMLRIPYSATRSKTEVLALLEQKYALIPQIYKQRAQRP